MLLCLDREQRLVYILGEIYRRIDGRWKIVHSHFSYTTPTLAE